MPSHEELLEGLLPIARAAGDAILEVYATDFGIRDKSDASPVTDADERAEALILRDLAALTPDIPIVSEEAAEAGLVPEAGSRFWLVDPLDGTKEFISRNGEFTTNIALIEQGRPVLGVVLVPAQDRLFAGAAGVGRLRGGRRGPPQHRLPHTTCGGADDRLSRSHGDAAALDAFLDGRPVAAAVTAGSSLKFCLVASGEADLYPRLGRTMEWDTAAGHAVLDAAGGRVSDVGGTELGYGKPGFENPHFVAQADAD